MSTESTAVTEGATGNSVTDNLTVEKVTYKGFAKWDEEGKIKAYNAKQESAKNEAWKNLEDAGYKLFNEIEFLKYIVHSEAGFTELVPDEEQRVYIIQAGLNYVQNAKASNVMSERADDNELQPKYNNTTFDLREKINEEPKKRVLTDFQKIERLLGTITASKDEKSAILAALMAKFQAEMPSETEQEEIQA